LYKQLILYINYYDATWHHSLDDSILTELSDYVNQFT